MEVPLHTLIKLTPKAYGTEEERFSADIPAVSTFREKGSHSMNYLQSPANTPGLDLASNPMEASKSAEKEEEK